MIKNEAYQSLSKFIYNCHYDISLVVVCKLCLDNNTDIQAGSDVDIQWKDNDEYFFVTGAPNTKTI